MALAAVAGLAVAAVWLLARRPPPLRPGSWKGQNVLFVTVDTLRADRLPAYGGSGVRTPTIDALAARGVVFERCITATPLTLPSHTTIFSGTLPLHHGVRDNGAFTVPKELPLLPELFRSHGYATAAFVGAFVLDSRWKLNRGFDVYFDQFDTRKANLVSIGDIERPAGEVVDAALGWLETRDPKKPFFLWIHLFDPHAPYVPPPPFAEEYADRPYLGEIAYVDSQLARVVAFLGARGLSGRTAVVLAGDHGESLGDHGEEGHGFFVYQEALHVPLLLASPGTARPARRSEVVSLADVLPTVVELSDLPLPAGVQGRSLVPLLSGRARLERRPVYSETYYPRLHFGWSELSSIQDGRYKLIESPEPELYDLDADPEEKKNLASNDRERYLAMKRQLVSLSDGWAKNPLNARPALQDPESVRKLASLGYLTGGADTAPKPGEARAAPRAKLLVYNKLNEAQGLVPTDPGKAEKMLREVLAEDPTVIDARVALANVCLKQRRNREAIPLLEESARQRPADVTLAVSLAAALLSDGRSRDAQTFLESRIEGGLEDARIFFLLASIFEGHGEPAKADSWFQRGVAIDPRSAPWHSAMAEVLWKRGDLDGADREAALALELDARVQGAHFIRASVLERHGRDAEAFEEYGRETAVNAVDERSFRSLTALARRLGRLDAEAVFLAESLRRHADAPWPLLYGSRNLLDRGQQLEDGVRLAQDALALASNDRQAAFACFLLADLYSRLGDPRRATEFAEKARTFERGAAG